VGNRIIVSELVPFHFWLLEFSYDSHRISLFNVEKNLCDFSKFT